MAGTRWRKLHELTRWDAYALLRMRNAANLRGSGPEVDWQARFDRQRPTPAAPRVRADVAGDAIRLRPEGQPTQLELGVLVAALANLRVTNAHDGFDPAMPWRLWPLIGADGFTKGNSWRRRHWRVPLELARAGQPYPAGWDGLAAALLAEPERLFTAAEIAHVATREIAATLTGAAAQDFWRANR
jgi:hypothetical protein